MRATPVLPHVGHLSGTFHLVVTTPDYGRSKRDRNRAESRLNFKLTRYRNFGAIAA
jgi:hypothetical protein